MRYLAHNTAAASYLHCRIEFQIDAQKSKEAATCGILKYFALLLLFK